MGEREEIEPLLDVLLDAIASECGRSREFLSLEIEQVVAQTLFAALRAGRRRQRMRRQSNTAYHQLPDRHTDETLASVPAVDVDVDLDE
ncbi:MAG: hypothetical protein GY769_20235 [bacterium]|nr:hypothetical protein [bacterium]